MASEPDLPEGFESWPPDVQKRFYEEFHALYFPKLRWWQKPETDDESSGPRSKQRPPDDPRHCLPDNRGYRCGCSHGIPNCLECPPCPGNPDWAIWLNLTGRGCVAGHTLIYLPLEDRHERIDVLAAAGLPVTVLALTADGPVPAVTEGAPFLKGVAGLYVVATEDGNVITVTDQHRFLTPEGWRQLADLRAGDELRAVDREWTQIAGITAGGFGLFYDMHVPGPENYAAEGLWSHNTGKTKAGSNWSLEMALSKPEIHVGVCGPTYEDVRSVAIEGESGIIAEARRNGIEIGTNAYNKNRQEVELPNGSKIRGFSAEKPDSIRGQNLSYVWFDELAAIRYVEFFHEGLMPALRKGETPRLMITTTPKRIRLIRKLIEDSRHEFKGKDGGPGTGVHLTEATSAENIHFSRKQRERLEREYAGNPVMLQQELQGKLLADAAGSLFPIEQFNETRVYPDKDTLPQWRRVVIAVDPATTNKDTSDETGIVAGAEGADGDFYILEDCSGRFSPDQQMRVVAEAYYRNNADCVVGETNMTGDYMRALLSTVDPNIPLRTVHGMKGKVSRAQGPSSLFMQGRVHMVGDNFRLLEDQLSAMAEGDDRNRMKDDRADACLAEGTLVLTSRGEVPIEQVVPGDLAWTRAGWKPVTATRCTQRNAEVITVFLSNGRELTGTGDHRIWTENDGWKRMDTLVWGDILSGWNHLRLSSSRGMPTTATRTARAEAIASITSTMQPGKSGTCIATFGWPLIRARKYPKAGTFITRTRTRSTTPRPTSSFSRRPSTASSILATSPGKKRIFSITLTGSARSPQSGTALRKAAPGIASTARSHGKAVRRSTTRSAPSAALRSSLGTTSRAAARPTTASALVFASTVPATRTRSIARPSRALSAGQSSSAISTERVPRPARVSVAGSCARGERRDVYDLTVADVHEFTAVGVIVHNCVWLLLHLSGSGQGNWAQVYGFRDCHSCGARVNEDKDLVCHNCGAKVEKQAPKHAGGRPAQIPWSEAYLKTCPNGHKYTPRERSCPECAPSPETVIQRALAGQGAGGPLGYMGGNWLAGRKF